MELALSATPSSTTRTGPQSLWLKDARWDLTFISLSAALVALPFGAYLLFQWALSIAAVRELCGVAPEQVPDISRNAVNALIALFIGGPHMYATFTRTTLDRQFRRAHWGYLSASLLIPTFVITVGVMHFTLLITCFFFWASVHIMHQIAYIIDSYNHRDARPISLPDRVLDYTVVFSSLYPLGVLRMVQDEFQIGNIKLLFPPFLMIKHNPTLGWLAFGAVTAVFAVSLLLWTARTWREFRAGTLHTPKALLMGLTIVVAFFIPTYHELDVAFQGFNTWHSFQYLGLTLYINQLRRQKSGIETPFLHLLAEPGKGWRFYLFNVGCAVPTVALIALLLLNREWLGFGFDQCYYIVVLSVLLIHYYHDHILFTDTGALKVA